MSIEKLIDSDYVYPQYYDKFNNLVDYVTGLTQGQIDDILLKNYLLKDSQNYEIVVATGTTIENGNELRTKLDLCYTKTPNGQPLSDSNRVVLYLMTGVYDLDTVGINIGEFVDIVGIGDAKNIIITSSDSNTIKIQNANNYSLVNLTINNSNSNHSIGHNSSQTDNGKWLNLILNAKNKLGTSFNGEYINIKGNVNEILCGDILSIVKDSSFSDYSCGYKNDGTTLTISGTIDNCKMNGVGFGYGNGNITISGIIKNSTAIGGFGWYNGSPSGSVSINFTSNCKIINCEATSVPAFGYGACPITMDGLIDNCKSFNAGFLHTSTGSFLLTVSGTISNSSIKVAPGFCYTDSGDILIASTGVISNCAVLNIYGMTYTNNGTLTMSGLIENCKINNNSLRGGLVSGSIIYGVVRNCKRGINSISSNVPFSIGLGCQLSGTIEDCEANLFGCNTTTSGKIRNCIVITSSGGGGSFYTDTSHLGLIDNCHVTTNAVSASGALINIGSGTTVKYSTFINKFTTPSDAIQVASGATVKIYHCTLNKAPNAVSGNPFTNLIDTPYNIIDPDVTL